MLDGVSFDQLRTFVTAVDEGSFSAAARHLRRAQSAVSEMVAALEGQIGVVLFDRSGRYPVLTDAGSVLLADARGVIAGVDFMKARARGIAGGVEPELSAVIDVFFPMHALTEIVRDFAGMFPHTPLRLYVEALGGVVRPILEGKASVGVVGSLLTMPASLTTEHLGEVSLVYVASSDHPLARIEGHIPADELARHIQIVLTDRTEYTKGLERGVMSPRTWRIADLYAKHAFLRNGLGWGGMPRHVVQDDLEQGRLVRLPLATMPPEGLALPLHAIYPTGTPPGPAARWLIERLKLCPRREPDDRPGSDGPAVHGMSLPAAMTDHDRRNGTVP